MRDFFKTRSLFFFPIIISTATVIFLTVLSQYLVDKGFDELLIHEDFISDAGAERALSQEIVKIIVADNLGGQLSSANLDELVYRFKKSNDLLITDVQELQQRSSHGKVLFEQAQLDSLIRSYQQLSELLKGSSDKINIVELLNSQDVFLLQIEQLGKKVSEYSKNAVYDLKRDELLIRIISLVIIFTEVVFIFLPAVKRIQKQDEQFRAICFNQSHIVRQPLSNIKGILHIISDAEPGREESKQLIELACSEAEKLDDVIKQNVTLAS